MSTFPYSTFPASSAPLGAWPAPSEGWPAAPSGAWPTAPSGAWPTAPSGAWPAAPSGAWPAAPSGAWPAAPSGAWPAAPSGAWPAAPSGAWPPQQQQPFTSYPTPMTTPCYMGALPTGSTLLPSAAATSLSPLNITPSEYRRSLYPKNSVGYSSLPPPEVISCSPGYLSNVVAGVSGTAATMSGVAQGTAPTGEPFMGAPPGAVAPPGGAGVGGPAVTYNYDCHPDSARAAYWQTSIGSNAASIMLSKPAYYPQFTYEKWKLGGDVGELNKVGVRSLGYGSVWKPFGVRPHKLFL